MAFEDSVSSTPAFLKDDSQDKVNLDLLITSQPQMNTPTKATAPSFKLSQLSDDYVDQPNVEDSTER